MRDNSYSGDRQIRKFFCVLLFWILLLLFGILLECCCVEAATYSQTFHEISMKALELKGDNDYVTAFNIDRFVNENIAYQFNRLQKPLIVSWNDLIGDCTDRAVIANILLKNSNIGARYVYGYAEYDGQWLKHDWYEFRYDGQWIDFEHDKFDGLIKIGYGIW